MNIKLIIGIIILIICCVLAFLISKFWINNCRVRIYPAPIERRVNNMDWYWIVAIVAAIAGIYWFFIK